MFQPSVSSVTSTREDWRTEIKWWPASVDQIIIKHYVALNSVRVAYVDYLRFKLLCYDTSKIPCLMLALWNYCVLKKKVHERREKMSIVHALQITEIEVLKRRKHTNNSMTLHMHFFNTKSYVHWKVWMILSSACRWGSSWQKKKHAKKQRSKMAFEAMENWKLILASVSSPNDTYISDLAEETAHERTCISYFQTPKCEKIWSEYN
jgi:hypothetical protein